VPAALELTRAMRCGRYLRAWSLTMLLVGLWHGAAPAAPAAPDQASVLILLPDQPGLPAAMAIVSGIRAVLLKEWSFRVTIEIEHVDVARFASPEAEERRLRTVYGSKYGHQRFDVIVAALPGPSRFIRRARDELWPGTPVVVCGVDERIVRDLKSPPGFAVLTIRFDMKGTVRAALSLLPDTRHVALVGGASQPEQVYHDLIRQAVSDVGGLDVIDLTNLSIADMLARVSNLPEHTIIVQSSYQVDGTGRRFYGIDLVPHVSNAANRPIFTPLDLALGRGVVGGSIVDFEDIGGFGLRQSASLDDLRDLVGQFRLGCRFFRPCISEIREDVAASDDVILLGRHFQCSRFWSNSAARVSRCRTNSISDCGVAMPFFDFFWNT
jgi:hypothetical protein